MMRFLHTSDWQLGMTRRFLSEEAQARYTQARFDAIRTMGRIAKEKQCQFMLVCGDSSSWFLLDRYRTLLLKWTKEPLNSIYCLQIIHKTGKLLT